MPNRVRIRRPVVPILVLAVLAQSSCRPSSKHDAHGAAGNEAAGSPNVATSPQPVTMSEDRSSQPSRSPTDMADSPPAPATSDFGDGASSARAVRPPDRRPQHNVEQLAEQGIRTYSSLRLRLHTDADPDDVAELPRLVDAAMATWEAWFGRLPTAADGSEFQMTGCVMREPAKFRELGLIPFDLPAFDHGRHRGLEFWLHDQPTAYYRRHLVLHEATHVYLGQFTVEMEPLWYHEGMAELIATHRAVAPTAEANSTPAWEYAVVPHQRTDVRGWGRIEQIQARVEKGPPPKLTDVLAAKPSDFFQADSYAWCWLACRWLSDHPRYGESFREVAKVHDARRLAEALAALPASRDALELEWRFAAQNVVYGYDFARNSIEFPDATPLLADAAVRETTVAANRGWQPSRVHVTRGERVILAANGTAVLGQRPRPWHVHPPGVSIRYVDGRPIGEFQSCVIPLPGSEWTPAHGVRQSIGERLDWTTPATGQIYLRINDSPAELNDNEGGFAVRLERATD